MKTTFSCLCSGIFAGMTVGTVVIFSGNQSKHLPLLYGVTGLAGLAGSFTSLVVLNDVNPTKQRLLKNIKQLKTYYASIEGTQNKLVKLSQIEEELWTL